MLTPEQEALLIELAKNKKAEKLLDIFDANSQAMENKRISKHNEILRAIQDSKYDLIPDINALDLEAKPDDALPDVVVAKE